MKCITLWQPWASCVALGLKRFETRSWATPLRGEIFIHAAARVPLAKEQAVFRGNAGWRCVMELLGVAEVLDLPYGAVLCKAHLVACVRAEEVTFTDSRADALEEFLGGFGPGRFAWELRDVVRFQPVPMKGAQGLWEPGKEDRNKLLLAGR